MSFWDFVQEVAEKVVEVVQEVVETVVPASDGGQDKPESVAGPTPGVPAPDRADNGATS